MVSKAEIQDELDKTRAELEAQLLAAARVIERQNAVNVRQARDLEGYKARESARMRSDHAAKQRELQAAEREDKRKRRQELAEGMLRMGDATEWAIVADEHGKVLELTVPLTDDIEPIVHGVLTKKDEAPKGGALGIDWAERIDALEGKRIAVVVPRHADARGALDGFQKIVGDVDGLLLDRVTRAYGNESIRTCEGGAIWFPSIGSIRRGWVRGRTLDAVYLEPGVHVKQGDREELWPALFPRNGDRVNA